MNSFAYRALRCGVALMAVLWLAAPAAAQIVPGNYHLHYAAGHDGSLTGTLDQTVARGANGTPVSATADAGFHFAGWSDGRSDNPRADTSVQGNVDVTASFAANAAWTLSVQIAGGHATADPAIQQVGNGQAASFAVRLDSGYAVAYVTGNTCTPAGGANSEYQVASVTANCVVTVTVMRAVDVTVDDGVSFIAYGDSSDFDAKIHNASAGAVSLQVTSTTSGGYVGASAQWQCTVSEPGDTCSVGSGQGNVLSNVSLGAGHDADIIVSVPAALATTATYARLTVNLTGDVTTSDSDTDTLVVFRNGFDAAVGHARPAAAGAEAFALPAPPGIGIDTPWSRTDGAGGRVSIRRVTLAGQTWLRLMRVAPGRMATGSAWARSDGGVLAVGRVDSGKDAWWLLEGSQPGLQLRAQP